MAGKIYLLLMLSLLFLVTGCSDEKENSAKEASYFETENYTMLGVEKNVGFILDEGENLIANKKDKYMWHLWGDQGFEGEEFKVTGVNLETDDKKTLVDGSLAGPHNGADGHTPSNMEFPSEGTWELSVFVGGELYEKMTVEVS
ncbi:hypothetical protein SAMN05216353_12532 [Halobacillus alkaliphilus]|uniref:DUF4871 domain-containing protein n=1 Tax=Halobacillus alkaliphilus TaxID=396056 RepID=A0A1I2PP54_9BACI|nr:hypothetical protein [Halobacillus alkaliphilus]SFG15211.1 hypothetical protein SAMN05216353_12532 [Halobacillus alkaliphilus]